jgi:hypothetical protein
MHGGTQRQEKPFSAFMGGVMWLTLPAKTRPTGGLAQVLATASQQMAAADNVIKIIGER